MVDHPQRELDKRIFHLKTLYDLSGEMLSPLLSSEEIVKNLLMMVMGTFGSLKGAILLVDVHENKVKAVSQRGMDHGPMDRLFKNVESGFFKNIEAAPEDWTGIEVPFEVNETLKGWIGLGEKMSGAGYGPDDRELLMTLANQGAVAIKNAVLVEQMKNEEVVRTNLARYLSPQVVERILHKGMQVDLGGHKSVVTVLFSDIRNFTTITESRPPDQLVHILNEYFTEMAGIIFDHQGSLDKYIGDAMVAVFGSLIPLENPARNAVQAAIRMMRRLPALNERWRKEYHFSMEIGIGIDTGEVFLGNIGSPERMEFTVIGDAVNVASRFSGIARPGQILVTRAAMDCLSPDIPYTALPPAVVKGKTGALEVFEIPYS